MLYLLKEDYRVGMRTLSTPIFASHVLASGKVPRSTLRALELRLDAFLWMGRRNESCECGEMCRTTTPTCSEIMEYEMKAT